MKRFLAIAVLLLSASVASAGFRWDYNTTDNMILLDSAGNTMVTFVDNGTTGSVQSSGGSTVDGNSTLTGTLDVTGASSVGKLTQNGVLVNVPTSVISIDTATVISASSIQSESFVLVKGSNTSGGFPVTNTGIVLSTASTYATNGQICRIMGTSATDTVSFTDSATFALNGDETYILGLGDNITMQYYTGIWYEVAKSTNN